MKEEPLPRKKMQRRANVETRGKHEVRLKGIDIPLTGSLNPSGKKQIAFRVDPGKWTQVHPDVYKMLMDKFDNPIETQVLDGEANEDHPHKVGEQPQYRTEQQQMWFLDFRSKE